MAKTPTTTTTETPALPSLVWVDPALRASQAGIDVFLGIVDDWSEIWQRTMLMWRRPMDHVAMRPVAPGFRAHADGKTFSEIKVGDTASYTRRVSQSDIDEFARISGDDNPAHVDRGWAERSRLKGRVAHGLLTAGLISAVLGTELPGPGAIYMSQTLKWLAPVRPGDVLTATVTVTEIVAEKERVTLETVVTRGDTTVLVGEAVIRPRPAYDHPSTP